MFSRSSSALANHANFNGFITQLHFINGEICFKTFFKVANLIDNL